MDHVFDFSAVLANHRLLLTGLGNTLKLAVVCLILGLLLGLPVGLARHARSLWLRWPATLLVELFRNTPVLVQMMWFFFAFPILASLDVDAFTAAALALTLNTMAFSAEIYRGGLQSIAPGQWEAAKALGMGYRQQMARVVLPQAVRRMIPAFMNRAIELVKMTSLASVIAYGELMHQAKTISNIAFNPIEMYTVVALIFFATIAPATVLVRRYEERLRRVAGHA